MASNGESDINHRSFLRWALSNGIQMNGVAPTIFPGRGMGMIATRTIEVNEIMLTVPLSTMLNTDCVPREFVDRFPHKTSIQTILAAFMTHGDASLLDHWALWRKTWPSRQELQESLPVLWCECPETHNLGHTTLPPSASGQWNLLSSPPGDGKVEETILSVFPTADWNIFSHHWFILNTRSFYYASPGKKPPDDWNDAIGLVPFADYFNHADKAPCEVVFDGETSRITATARLEKGVEVFTNYGEHPKDYLFVEYGFFLDQNGSDAVYLDDIISQNLTIDDKEALRTHGYDGHYEINSSGPSLDVKDVACFKCMKYDDWKLYVFGPSSVPAPDEATKLVHKWVKVYWEECILAIKGLEGKTGLKEVVGSSENPWPNLKDQKIATLLRRWIQVRDLSSPAWKIDTLDSIPFMDGVYHIGLGYNRYNHKATVS